MVPVSLFIWIALETAEYGVTVNCIKPGRIIFEVEGCTLEIAKEAFHRAHHKRHQNYPDAANYSR